MRALRLVAFAPLTMELESYELPDAPPPGTLLVEARTTAISAGTEIANYRGATPYHSAANPDWSASPYYPGYSLAGVVRAVGEGVTGFGPGDRVCGWGPHASAAIVDAARFATIPETVSFDHAAMTTLTVIVMNAVRLARIELGERVGVVGAGLIGQLALQLSRLCGARPTVAIDPIEARLELARRCGATVGLDPTAAGADEQLERLTGGRELDVVFEATGSPAAFNPALRRVRFGGRLILLGSTRGLVESFDPYADVHRKGITIVGAHVSSHPSQPTHFNRWTAASNQRLALDLMSDGSLQIEPLISHRIPGDEGAAMFERLAESRGASSACCSSGGRADPDDRRLLGAWRSPSRRRSAQPIDGRLNAARCRARHALLAIGRITDSRIFTPSASATAWIRSRLTPAYRVASYRWTCCSLSCKRSASPFCVRPTEIRARIRASGSSASELSSRTLTLPLLSASYSARSSRSSSS
jgi:2-desacetyl-2-hydroxyethyl bacteriochlorophyllide A dehydrogenase